MKYQKIADNYLVVARRGDGLISCLKDFCKKEKITNGFFSGIGAVCEAEIAHYSVEDKKFSSFKLNEPLEMVSFIGNVFPDEDGELIIHAHASFGRANGELVGGHLIEGQVSGVGEIMLTPFSSSLVKAYDKETGLKIADW
jgi:uncharacterized protein